MKKQQGHKKPKRNQTGIPQIESSLFKQKIIIDNPNIDINKIEKNIKFGQITLYNPKQRGVEQGHFQKKIKQLGETWKVGFFKNGVNNSSRKNKNLSPYLIHKIRTQDIRHATKELPKQISSFRELNNLSIKKETSAPLQKDHEESLSKIDWRKRAISKVSKGKNFSSQKKISTLEPYLKGPLTEKKEIISQKRVHLNIRKNRFNRLDSSSRQKTQENQQNEKKNSKIENLQNYLVLNQESPKHHSQQFNRQINKSIEKINTSFMKKVDNYFDDIETVDIPSSKIQLYTATISHPLLPHGNQNHYRSVFKEDENSYDIGFGEENKIKKPKAPYKRKKMYEKII